MTEAGTITQAQRARFLEELANSRNVTIAARAAGIARRAVLSLRARDADFAAASQDAEEEASDLLEHEARQRAMKGVEEPVYYHGQEVGKVRRYSETLLLMFLRAERPEKFADKGTAAGTAKSARAKLGGGVLVVPEKPNPEEWARSLQAYQRQLANGGGA
jgi:hypothetical protein